MTPNPDTDDAKAKKDADIRAIIERREAEFREWKEAEAETERVKREQKEREEKAFHADVVAAKERAEAKEEWRRGQHEKRRELEQERLRKLEEEKIERQKRDAEKAKQEEQKEYMKDLHRVSMFKKAAAMRKAALLELEHAMTIARDHRSGALRDWEYRHGRDKRNVDVEAKTAAKRLEQQSLPPEQKKKRLQDLEADRLRKLQELEHSFKHQKDEIEAAHTREVAKAEQVKNEAMLLADKTQRL